MHTQDSTKVKRSCHGMHFGFGFVSFLFFEHYQRVSGQFFTVEA